MSYRFADAIKINIVSMFYPPETGAAASRISKMAASLQQRGADVEVITAFPNYPTGKIYQGYRGSLVIKETCDGLVTRRYWLYPSNSKKILLRIANMLSFSLTILLSLPYLLRRRPDLLIINSPPLLSGFTAVLLSKITGAKTLVNISDIWPLSAYELGAISKNGFYRFLEKLEAYIYAAADACTAQSQQTVEHIKKQQPDKAVFLYRNLDHISPYIESFPSVESGRIKIVYAGLLGVAQGLHGICKNIQFNALGIELHIYGDGNERELIQSYIKSNPDCGVFYHGTLPKAQIPQALADYHATLIPLASSIYGAFPSKIYMAIASGLPVLYCGGGEGARTVEQLSLGWVSEPSDYRQLEANLRALNELSSGEYDAMRESIRELAKHQFSFDNHADELTEFIDRMRN